MNSLLQAKEGERHLGSVDYHIVFRQQLAAACSNRTTLQGILNHGGFQETIQYKGETMSSYFADGQPSTAFVRNAIYDVTRMFQYCQIVLT